MKRVPLNMTVKIKSIFATSLLLTSLAVLPTSAAPSTQTYSGTGDSVQDINPIKAASIFTITYEGEGAFVVHPIDATGKEGYYLALEIDSWSGTVYQQAVSKPIVAVGIKAEGDWTVAISPIASSPVVGTKNISGTGSAVVKWVKPSKGFKKIAFTHDGEGAFVVHPIDTKGKQGFYAILEIGTYQGSVLLKSGTQYLSIKADGNWTFSVK